MVKFYMSAGAARWRPYAGMVRRLACAWAPWRPLTMEEVQRELHEMAAREQQAAEAGDAPLSVGSMPPSQTKYSSCAR